MKNRNLVYKINKNNCEKRSGGSSVNYICFNKKVFETSSSKHVHPLQRSYLKWYALRKDKISLYEVCRDKK